MYEYLLHRFREAAGYHEAISQPTPSLSERLPAFIPEPRAAFKTVPRTPLPQYFLRLNSCPSLQNLEHSEIFKFWLPTVTDS